MLIAVIALFPTVPSSAARSERAPSTVVLRGRNTFTATSISKVVFNLPKRVNFDEDFDVDVNGNGRAYGAMFWASGKQPFDFEAKVPSFSMVLPGLCAERACKADKDVVAWVHTSGFEGFLPAGNYELYVIADGAPVTVTLKVRSLSGRLKRKAVPVRSEVQTIAPTVSQPGATRVYSGGGFSSLHRRRMGFFTMWALGSNATAMGYGSCTYTDDSRRDFPAGSAFLPGCPTGARTHHLLEGPTGGVVFTSVDAGGSPGLGGWFASPDGMGEYGAVALWF